MDNLAQLKANLNRMLENETDPERRAVILSELEAVRQAEEPERIELDGLQSMRLLSAGQALQMPTGFYGVTHKQARAIIAELIGFCPEGKPEGSSMEDVLAWCGLTEAA